MTTATVTPFVIDAAPKTKATIYHGGMFGIVRTEITLTRFGRRPLAQYPADPFVDFVEKGKRTPKRWNGGGNQPFAIIIAGWGHPDPQDPWVPSNPGMKQTRYPSFDPRYETDFNRDMAGYLATVEILADFRHTLEVTPIV